jgi:hypothetical protein
MSKMRCCALKYVSMAQPAVGQLATGVPRSEVENDDALLEMDVGMLLRLKNQILYRYIMSDPGWKSRRAHEMPDEANSVTNTPPCAAANFAP